MLTCINCGHEVKKNYYGGWIHAQQWINYCSELIEDELIKKHKLTGAEPCGCTKPEGE